MDTERDPDELINFCQDAQYREVVQALAKELLQYMRVSEEPRIKNKKMVADLERCAA